MQTKTGVLLVNLGTPDSPSPRDVYRYLAEFLTDERVIDRPWLFRQLLVRGLIIPRRYKQSAKAYSSIWTIEGSPLKVYGYRLQKKLQERLGDAYAVQLGMRYQNPSLHGALERLIDQNCRRIVVLPMFPQYASATTGSVHQKIMEIASKWQTIPAFSFIDHYANDLGLIDSFCAVAASYNLADYDHILFSFHGLPQSQLIKADRSRECCMKSRTCCATFSNQNQDCYAAQCHATAAALTTALKLPPHKYSITFQSRLGKEPWLQPYTGEVIHHLAKEGKKRILVFCPAFVCDCLETIYEIGVEYAEEFKNAGGESLDLVPGLNDHPRWIEALADLIKEKERR
jgi:protoporphyrin/coproporphyrin ferrochelatase